MDYKRFNLIVLLLLVTVCASVAAINYVVDPYGIFRKDFTRQREELNSHFVKMRHLLGNPAKYDSLLIGSSRVGKIDVRRLGDGRYYNLSYPVGVPGAHLEDITMLLAKGMRIKSILMGLDDFSYKVDPAGHRHVPLTHPYGSWLENLYFYTEYLLKIPRMRYIKEYRDKRKVKIYYDIYETGMPLHKQEDERIERNVQAHVNDRKFASPCYHRGDRIEETIKDIEEIKAVCEYNNIKLYVFINPIHKTTYIDGGPNTFDEFKRKLVQIVDFYDFSGLNSVTIDNYCYYETSHYRYFIGDFIIARIFNDNSVQVPEDFGVLVNKDNIEAHLISLRQSLEDKSIVPFSTRNPPGVRQTFGASR
ncbi:MAG: hypothetical protein AB9873_15000 [Syntrophobacteraceae bacterium]